jgi:DNA damage-inducible protein 1
MQIVITTLDGNIHPIEVSADLDILNFKALCEQETRIPIGEISLTFNGQPMNDDTKTLEGYGIVENDIVMVQKIMKNLPLIDFSSIQVPQPPSRSASGSFSFLLSQCLRRFTQ